MHLRGTVNSVIYISVLVVKHVRQNVTDMHSLKNLMKRSAKNGERKFPIAKSDFRCKIDT